MSGLLAMGGSMPVLPAWPRDETHGAFPQCGNRQDSEERDDKNPHCGNKAHEERGTTFKNCLCHETAAAAVAAGAACRGASPIRLRDELGWRHPCHHRLHRVRRRFGHSHQHQWPDGDQHWGLCGQGVLQPDQRHDSGNRHSHWVGCVLELRRPDQRGDLGRRCHHCGRRRSRVAPA